MVQQLPPFFTRSQQNSQQAYPPLGQSSYNIFPALPKTDNMIDSIAVVMWARTAVDQNGEHIIPRYRWTNTERRHEMRFLEGVAHGMRIKAEREASEDTVFYAGMAYGMNPDATRVTGELRITRQYNCPDHGTAFWDGGKHFELGIYQPSVLELGNYGVYGAAFPPAVAPLGREYYPSMMMGPDPQARLWNGPSNAFRPPVPEYPRLWQNQPAPQLSGPNAAFRPPVQQCPPSGTYQPGPLHDAFAGPSYAGCRRYRYGRGRDNNNHAPSQSNVDLHVPGPHVPTNYDISSLALYQATRGPHVLANRGMPSQGMLQTNAGLPLQGGTGGNKRKRHGGYRGRRHPSAVGNLGPEGAMNLEVQSAPGETQPSIPSTVNQSSQTHTKVSRHHGPVQSQIAARKEDGSRNVTVEDHPEDSSDGESGEACTPVTEAESNDA